MNYQPFLEPEGYYRCDPSPSNEDLQKYYQEEFYQGEKPGFVNDSAKEVRDSDSNFYNLQYSIFSSLLCLSNTGCHVDLGCGFGHFLEYIASFYPGLRLRGCEVYPEAAEYVESIKSASFKQIDLNTLSNLKECVENASSVSLVNTLEHLRDPIMFLKGIKKHLNPSSKLLIQVPNDFNPIQNAAVKQLGLDEWWFCPPRHVSYFTPASLSACVKSAGLIVSDMITTFPIDMFLICGFNYRDSPKLGREAHNMRTLFEANYSKANGLDGLINLYRNFSNAGIGREIVAIVESP